MEMMMRSHLVGLVLLLLLLCIAAHQPSVQQQQQQDYDDGDVIIIEDLPMLHREPPPPPPPPKKKKPSSSSDDPSSAPKGDEKDKQPRTRKQQQQWDNSTIITKLQALHESVSQLHREAPFSRELQPFTHQSSSSKCLLSCFLVAPLLPFQSNSAALQSPLLRAPLIGDDELFSFAAKLQQAREARHALREGVASASAAAPLSSEAAAAIQQWKVEGLPKMMDLANVQPQQQYIQRGLLVTATPVIDRAKQLLKNAQQNVDGNDDDAATAQIEHEIHSLEQLARYARLRIRRGQHHASSELLMELAFVTLAVRNQLLLSSSHRDADGVVGEGSSSTSTAAAHFIEVGMKQYPKLSSLTVVRQQQQQSSSRPLSIYHSISGGVMPVPLSAVLLRDVCLCAALVFVCTHCTAVVLSCTKLLTRWFKASLRHKKFFVSSSDHHRRLRPRLPALHTPTVTISSIGTAFSYAIALCTSNFTLSFTVAAMVTCIGAGRADGAGCIGPLLDLFTLVGLGPVLSVFHISVENSASRAEIQEMDFWLTVVISPVQRAVVFWSLSALALAACWIVQAAAGAARRFLPPITW